MIYKECLALVTDRPITITGRLVASQSSMTTYPVLAIRAVVPQTRTAVAEATSTDAGEFRLELGVPTPISLSLELIDANGVVVATVLCDVCESTHVAHLAVPEAALTAAAPIARENTDPPLLRPESVTALRSRVAALIEEGRLDRDAATVMESTLRPLAWLDTLMPDVRGALAGRIESAERLRSALLGIAAPELPDASRGTPAGGADGDTERPDAMRLLDRAGLAQVFCAVLWAVDDLADVQGMLDGLGAVLGSSPRLELLLRASTAGETGAMMPLMGGPGPGFGLPPGLPGGLPGLPGLPPLPGLPGSKPKVIPVKLGDLVPDLKVPINLMPSEQEKCLIGAMATVAIRKRQLPQYEIQAIDNPAACPGQIVVLTGRNFGSTGSVVFPGKGAGVPAQDVASWTDTAIRVRVPAGAAPGIIRLSIYEGSLCLCGRVWPIYRVGKTLPTFDGGIPVILEYTVNAASSGFTAEPLATVAVTITSSVGAGVTINLTVRNSGTVIFSSGGLPGGFQSLTFAAPDARAPVALEVELSATNHCGNSVERFTIRVVKQPRLRIAQAEVTQAIQRLNNSVRLAGRRSTLVRVFVDSGLDLFGFTGAPSSLPGVTGTLSIWRGAQRLAGVAPLNSPFTTSFFFFPYARHTTDTSINFLLPFELLEGELRLDINLRLQSLPDGVVDGPHCTATRSVHVKFEPPRRRSLVRIMVADAWRGLPAPQVSEWQTALQGAVTRFPIADDGWEIRIHPGYTVITVDYDLSDREGWEDVVDEIDDIADDASDSWDHTWIGLLPAFRPDIDTFRTRGLGTNDPDEYRTMAVLAGRPEVFAHELGHTVGLGHANCSAGSIDDVDPSLPPYIEEPAVDVHAMRAMTEGITGDLMGYCDRNGLWPSIVTWTRFLDRT